MKTVAISFIAAAYATILSIIFPFGHGFMFYYIALAMLRVKFGYIACNIGIFLCLFGKLFEVYFYESNVEWKYFIIKIIFFTISIFIWNYLLEQLRKEKQKVDESEKRYEIITATASDVIIGINRNSIIEFVNPALENVFGYKQKEIMNKPITMLMPHNYRTKHLKAIDNYLKTNKKNLNWNLFSTKGLTKNGRIIDIEISIGETNYRGKKIFIGVIRDVTSKKLMERELLLKTENLLEMDKQKNEFIAILAHELRNPLAPLMNAVNIMKIRDADDELLKKSRDIIERQVIQMSSMINDLLDVSKMIRGRVDVKLERIDLCDYIKKIIRDTNFTIKKQKITIEVWPSPIWIQADTERLAQIAGNLIQNAIKFTQEGGEIKITVCNDKKYGYLIVEDNGEGIDSEILKNLFNEYSPLDLTMKRSKQGLGLGLTIVKQLAKLHGGDVYAESEGIGKGSKFVVNIPLDSEFPIVLPSEEDLIPSKISKKILVVEDDMDSADSLKELLEILGHEVIIAHDGLKAIDILYEKNLDIVICDIGLPGLDGYGVAAAIRTSSKFNKIKLIALSGYDTENDKQQSEKAGFNYHLVKPVNPIQLQRFIDF